MHNTKEKATNIPTQASGSPDGAMSVGMVVVTAGGKAATHHHSRVVVVIVASSEVYRLRGSLSRFAFADEADASRTLGCRAHTRLYQLVAVLRDTELDGLENGALFEHRALSVTLGLGLQPLADGADIDEPTLEELVVDDDFPRRPGG
jgi:hypothetical protein